MRGVSHDYQRKGDVMTKTIEVGQWVLYQADPDPWYVKRIYDGTADVSRPEEPPNVSMTKVPLSDLRKAPFGPQDAQGIKEMMKGNPIISPKI